MLRELTILIRKGLETDVLTSINRFHPGADLGGGGGRGGGGREGPNPPFPI